MGMKPARQIQNGKPRRLDLSLNSKKLQLANRIEMVNSELRNVLKEQGKRPIELLNDYKVTLFKQKFGHDLSNESLKVTLGSGKNPSTIAITHTNTAKVTIEQKEDDAKDQQKASKSNDMLVKNQLTLTEETPRQPMQPKAGVLAANAGKVTESNVQHTTEKTLGQRKDSAGTHGTFSTVVKPGGNRSSILSSRQSVETNQQMLISGQAGPRVQISLQNINQKASRDGGHNYMTNWPSNEEIVDLNGDLSGVRSKRLPADGTIIRNSSSKK